VAAAVVTPVVAEAATPVKSIVEDAREWIARYQAVMGRGA